MGFGCHPKFMMHLLIVLELLLLVLLLFFIEQVLVNHGWTLSHLAYCLLNGLGSSFPCSCVNFVDIRGKP